MVQNGDWLRANTPEQPGEPFVARRLSPFCPMPWNKDVAMRRTCGVSIALLRISGATLCRQIMAVLLLLGLVSELACVSTTSQPPAIGFAEPPRAELEASLAQERIKSSDVLQVKLADGTVASVTQTYHVAPDGTIELSGHGKIQVAGKTLQQVQEAIQQATAVTAAASEVVDVTLSEYYLVTVDEYGAKHLTRVPFKGEPSVKDALANVPKVSDKVIWIARPNPSRYLSEQVLPVDWDSVSRDATSPTNFKLKPGDWLFVAHEPAAGLARVYNSVTGMFGASQLPSGTEMRTDPR